MIEIQFKIQSLPHDLEQPYSLPAYTEGEASLLAEGKQVFKEDGILLVELAYEVMKWLSLFHRGERGDFYYASMDFEEEPVLAFLEKDNDHYVFESVWKSGDAEVAQQDLVCAFEEFIERLSNELKQAIDVSLADSWRSSV